MQNERVHKKECREDMVHFSSTELAGELMARGREGVIFINMPGEKAILLSSSGSAEDVIRIGMHLAMHVGPNIEPIELSEDDDEDTES